MAAGDTTGISGLKGSGNFRENLTKEQPAFGENGRGCSLLNVQGDISSDLKFRILESRFPKKSIFPLPS